MTSTDTAPMTHRELRPGMAAQRKKIHWAARHSSARVARSWNDLYGIGTTVKYRGVVTQTESPAASNADWEPAVFLAGIEEPARLIDLEIVRAVPGKPPN